MIESQAAPLTQGEAVQIPSVSEAVVAGGTLTIRCSKLQILTLLALCAIAGLARIRLAAAIWQ